VHYKRLVVNLIICNLLFKYMSIISRVLDSVYRTMIHKHTFYYVH